MLYIVRNTELYQYLLECMLYSASTYQSTWKCEGIDICHGNVGKLMTSGKCWENVRENYYEGPV